MRLKTEEEIENDLYRAAVMVKRQLVKKDAAYAATPLIDIVKRLKVIRKRDGIGGFSRWH